MHIPDNYLSPLSCAAAAAVMVPVWVLSVKKVRQDTAPSRVSEIGIAAAFSFLVMMFNIPLPGGTTGHAVGAVLAAILLGPWAACLAVSAALFIQALLFADGGILAFGANAFNMAFIMPFSGFFLYRFLTGISKNETFRFAAAAVSGYIALNLAALSTAVMFGLQPMFFRDAAGLALYSPYPLPIALPAMMVPHLLVAGFVEALFTAGVLAYISRVSPGMINKEAAGTRMAPLYIMLSLLALLAPIGLLAAGTAWGEWGAEELGSMLGYIPAGMKNGFELQALFPDYTVPAVGNEILGYVLSAVTGTALMIIIFKLTAPLLVRRKRA